MPPVASCNRPPRPPWRKPLPISTRPPATETARSQPWTFWLVLSNSRFMGRVLGLSSTEDCTKREPFLPCCRAASPSFLSFAEPRAHPRADPSGDPPQRLRRLAIGLGHETRLGADHGDDSRDPLAAAEQWRG